MQRDISKYTLYIICFRFVVVCGDGEYIIYTAMALRNKSFGSAQEFVWAADSSEYAVRENASTIKLFKNFKERKSFRPDFGAEAIYGGHLLGVKSPSGTIFVATHLILEPKIFLKFYFVEIISRFLNIC